MNANSNQSESSNSTSQSINTKLQNQIPKNRERSRSLLMNGTDHDTILTMTHKSRQKSVSFTKSDVKHVKSEYVQSHLQNLNTSQHLEINRISCTAYESNSYHRAKLQKPDESATIHSETISPVIKSHSLDFKDLCKILDNNFNTLSKLKISISDDELYITKKKDFEAELLDIKLFFAVNCRYFESFQININGIHLELYFNKFEFKIILNSSCFENRYITFDSLIKDINISVHPSFNGNNLECLDRICGQIVKKMDSLNLNSLNILDALKTLIVFSANINDLLSRLNCIANSNPECLEMVIKDLILNDDLRFIQAKN